MAVEYYTRFRPKGCKIVERVSIYPSIIEVYLIKTPENGYCVYLNGTYYYGPQPVKYAIQELDHIYAIGFKE
jgi:hypothetical protein